MKYRHMLHEKTREPGTKCAYFIDAHLSNLPVRFLNDIENQDWKICVAETEAQVHNWFPNLSSTGFQGVTSLDEKLCAVVDPNYATDSTAMYNEVLFHELFHAGYFSMTLYEKTLIEQIYVEEKDLYREGDSLADYGRTNTREYFVRISLDFHYQFVLNKDFDGLGTLYFAKAPKSLKFLRENIFNSKPGILRLLENEQKIGALDVKFVPKAESVSGKDGIKVTYKDGSWSAFDLPTMDHFIQRSDTINFSTSYSAIPHGKITYSRVIDGDKIWLLKSIRISPSLNDYEISQERSLLPTLTNDASVNGQEILERRFFDYNNSRTWTAWKKVNS